MLAIARPSSPSLGVRVVQHDAQLALLSELTLCRLGNVALPRGGGVMGNDVAAFFRIKAFRRPILILCPVAMEIMDRGSARILSNSPSRLPSKAVLSSLRRILQGPVAGVHAYYRVARARAHAAQTALVRC